jgi:hypothetical protein
MNQVGASIIMLGLTLLVFSLILQMQRWQDRPQPGAVCPACGRVMP